MSTATTARTLHIQRDRAGRFAPSATSASTVTLTAPGGLVDPEREYDQFESWAESGDGPQAQTGAFAAIDPAGAPF